MWSVVVIASSITCTIYTAGRMTCYIIKISTILIILIPLILTFMTSHDDSNQVSATSWPKKTFADNGTLPSNKKETLFAKQNLKKKHIVVATIEVAPFMMKRPVEGQPGTFEWYGYCMDFFQELIKHLPYEVTYEIYHVPDNKFGSRSKHNNVGNEDKKEVERWNGLIGNLNEGKSILALAPLAVMAERELAIDFTVPFYDLVGIQILLKKPEVPQDWFKFLTVLDGEVWFSITIAYFVTSFVMYLFDRLSPYSHKNQTRIQKLKKIRKFEGPIEVNRESPLESSRNNSFKTSDRSARPVLMGNFRKEPLSNELMTKSHQIGVGNHLSSNGVGGGLRKTSLFLLPGFDPVYNKDKNSSLAASENAENRRPSKTLSDYFRGVQFRKSVGAWDGDETDGMDDGKPDFGLRDSLWFCITSLTPQGGGEAPQNLSGRIVAGAWWLFCFIIIASYTANLAAFLTVSRLDIPIDSLDDLAQQYRIKYAPIDGTAEQTYFERMAHIEEIFYNIWKEMSLNESLSEEERSKFAVWDYPISDRYTKIWAQIQQVGMPQDAESGIKRVRSSSLDDGFALLADANMVKYAVMTDCNFKAVGEEFSRKPIALGVRKGEDQFRDDLSYAILQLINQRYMEILREKWWTNNPDRVICDNNDESEGIRLENIVGVFIIIFAGVVLSFFVWAIERFVYRTKLGVSEDIIQNL